MFKLRTSFTLLALTWTLAHAPTSLASSDSYCSWSFEGPIPMTYHRNMGTVHVPRDAPIGAVIGQLDNNQWTRTDGRRLLCYNHGDGTVMRMRFVEQVPIFPRPLPPIDGDNSDGHILQTGIDGVGVRIRVRDPFHGVQQHHFDPEHGHTLVPFSAAKTTQNALGTVMGLLVTQVTFVKTGDIAPGSHRIDAKELFKAYLDYESFGEVFRYVLSANIIQAECSISATPVTPNPVDLLEWDRSHFTGPGTTTTTVPFSINLQGCVSDPSGSARVTLKLDPTNGSQSSPTYPGVMSLSTDADATGVGIQVVKDDGSPLALDREQAMLPIGTGSMQLNLGARLFQTDPTVTAGSVKGALNFTLFYR